MKLKRVTAALLLALCCCAAQAEPASKATIEELLEVTQSQKMMDAVYAQMDGMMKQSTQGMVLSEAQRPIMEKHLAKSAALIKQELSWDKIKHPMAEAYARVYTEAEVRDIIEFYKSPAGQKMLAKMPELMQESMVLIQESMKDLMPKIAALQQALQKELKAE